MEGTHLTTSQRARQGARQGARRDQCFTRVLPNTEYYLPNKPSILENKRFNTLPLRRTVVVSAEPQKGVCICSLMKKNFASI